MCRILLANTLSASYRGFFEWQDQTFAYFSVARMASERFNRLKILYNQKFELEEDGWRNKYLKNISWDYREGYSQLYNMTVETQTRGNGTEG